jgi:hypothetical protein
MSGPARDTRPRSAARIFAIPLLLAAMSGFGLVAALLVDGPLDMLWTLAVAAPILAAAWVMRRRGG